MKILNILYFLILVIYLPRDLFAQDKTSNATFLTPFVSYGSENGRGNIGFSFGIKASKTLSKRVSWDGGLTYFSSNLININQNSTTFTGEDRYYHSVFITPSLSLRMIGKDNSKFIGRLSLGPSLKYYNYKDFRSGLLRVYSDGRVEAAPGATIDYNENNGFNISFYGAMSFDAKISEKLRAGLFLDTYSSSVTPLEHLMPGIQFSIKL